VKFNVHDLELIENKVKVSQISLNDQMLHTYGTWYSERVILQFRCVGCWAGVTYLRYTVLTSPKKGKTAVHCCDPTFLVYRNVFHVVSALQFIVCLHTILFLADQISCRSYTGSVYRMRSLAVSGFWFWSPKNVARSTLDPGSRG